MNRIILSRELQQKIISESESFLKGKGGKDLILMDHQEFSVFATTIDENEIKTRDLEVDGLSLAQAYVKIGDSYVYNTVLK